jgi:hypothetical protein
VVFSGIRNFVKSIFRNSKRKKQLFAFLVSLFISGVLWLLIALDRNYTTVIEIKIKLTNLPEGKIPMDPLPEQIVVAINARGWEILKLKRRRHEYPVEIPQGIKGNAKLVVQSSTIRDKIRDYFPDDIKILGISPEIITVELDKIMTREVRIVPGINLKFKKQYGLSGDISLEPATVEVRGPETYVASIKNIMTERYSKKEIDGKINKTMKLLPQKNTNITYNFDEVKMSVPVEKLTEGQFIIPVKIFNPGKKKITLIPDKIEVSFQAPLSIFDKVHPESFTIYTDAQNMKANRKKLRVLYEVKMKGVYFVKLVPDNVDYIIEK